MARARALRRAGVHLAVLCLLAGEIGCAAQHKPVALAALPGATVFEGGRKVGFDVLFTGTAKSALVCVGEQHDDRAHHRVQTEMLSRLAEQSDARDVKLALGMEMFRRHMQPALDAFYDGEIDAPELARVTHWDDEWGFDFGMYEPMLTLARARRVRIIGLNAPRALTRAVSRAGLAGLPEPVRESLPELVLDDAEHRKFFWAIMGFDGGGGHGHGHAMNPERFYAAQVIWDETMAEGASAWLSDPQPRQIMVVAGNGHCHESAVPRRVARRQRREALSVLVRTKGDELPLHAESDFVIEVE